MFIDTHSHLNFDAFLSNVNEVINRSLNNNLWMINVGTSYETSKKAVEIAQKYEKGVYTAIGLHPLHLETGLVKIKMDREEIETEIREEDFDYKKYKQLAKFEKVVAIGEIGLDYYWQPKTTKKKELFYLRQKDLLFKQLELAKELNLPVIFHCRMAHQHLIEFLTENKRVRPQRAVVHGFVGNLEELKEYLNFGFYIGFNGIIFKNIEGIDFHELIKSTPLDKLLIETDCPYLTPPQIEGRNEPLYVKYIAEEIAKIKNRSYEEIAKFTTQNARNLFQI